MHRVAVRTRYAILALIAVLVLFSLITFLRYDVDNDTIEVNTREILQQRLISLNNVEVLSLSPRVFLYKGLLTPEECEHIINIGKDKLTRSMVVGPDGKAIVDSARTSYGAFLSGKLKKDPVLKSLAQKIEEWTQLPQENGEDFYLLRYEVGQQYKPHTDFFDPSRKLDKRGNRIATVLVYLSDVEEGGETVFPRAAGGELAVKPRIGDAILFYDFTPNNEPDYKSLHGGKPVIKGTKWSLTRWIRQRH